MDFCTEKTGFVRTVLSTRTENRKKIEPVVVKLCSKTKYITFSEHGVYIVSNDDMTVNIILDITAQLFF